MEYRLQPKFLRSPSPPPLIPSTPALAPLRKEVPSPYTRLLLLLHPRRLVSQCRTCHHHAYSHITPTTHSPTSVSISHLHACSSALAIAAALNRASSSSPPAKIKPLSTAASDDDLCCSPSDEFLALCKHQLEFCRASLHGDGDFTVYVRTAESYKSSELKLRHVLFKTANSAENLAPEVVLNFVSENRSSIRETELAFTKFQVVELPDHGASVLPMVKGSILVGILVAEWFLSGDTSVPLKIEKSKENNKEEDCLSVGDLKQPSSLDMTPIELVEAARCLALACVLDQRAVLLQQSSWKKSVQINNLFEQAQGPLTTIRTLGKLLLMLLKGSEISRDVAQDILVQGDRMKDILSQIQEDGARLVQLKQTVIDMHENPTKKSGCYGPNFRSRPSLEGSNNSTEDSFDSLQPVVSTLPQIGSDKELPMPPLTLAPPYNQNIRTCDVSDLLLKLVKAANGLALKRNQTLELHCPHGQLLAVIEQNVLYHALSSLLDGALQHSPSGGWIRAEVMRAPGGGVLVIIEDNGPDISVAAQAQILSPLGPSSKAFACESDVIYKMGEELAIARGILEPYGIVLCIKSPHLLHAPVGNGGIHLEIWLPAPSSTSDPDAM